MPKYKTSGEGIKKWQTANKDCKLAINRTKKRIRELESGKTKASSTKERKWYTDEIDRLKAAIKEMS